ncbi:hypothetical protein [Thiothrix lacustris]|uniref:hypothetical protein n=1 Tax=Thiothrix lacustris TaxID=525917 RepID=UPI00048FC329|nr:hypothetical protein [Thiothrix lacustris]
MKANLADRTHVDSGTITLLHGSLLDPERNNVGTHGVREKVAIDSFQLLANIMRTPCQQQTLYQLLLYFMAGTTQLAQAEITLFEAFLQFIFFKFNNDFSSLPIVQANKWVNPIKPCIYVKGHHIPRYSFNERNNLAGAELQSHTLAWLLLLPF